ncbi:MAG TPA: TRAP transporter small permease [Spirochaetota bacterium]|nr:TRAP transporter small permease [Spirochaetota bacterium]HPP04855.1 TRAP transporter small permease [Spirochaetota bacterium]
MADIQKKMPFIERVKIFLKSIVNIITKIEEIILILLLCLIIFISFSQLILSFFDSFLKSGFLVKFVWFDSLLKYSVLWIAMVAASIATSENKHINIDLIGKLTKGRFKSFVKIINNFFAGIITTILTVISIIYIIKIEYTSNDPAPFLNIRRWILLIPIPVGFLLMSFKFILKGIKYIYNFIHKIEE